MRKRRVSTSVCSGLAILAGSFTFMGSADAASIFSENFEGAANIFSAGTYAYSQNYTMPNLLTPGGGLKYMNGGAGVLNQVSTNNFSSSTTSLLTGGITGAQIDAGQVSYNLYSQFSTYRLQGDYATVFLRFFDGSSTPLGSPVSIGGAAFTAALGSGNNGSYPDARNWGADSLAGLVPANARFAQLSVQEVKTAVGTAIDGYLDNISLNVDIPEPSSLGLWGLGAGLLAFLRKRR
jgi:hypothetical protein